MKSKYATPERRQSPSQQEQGSSVVDRGSTRAAYPAQKEGWLMERARGVSLLQFVLGAGVMAGMLSPVASFAAACEQAIAKAMAVEGKVDARAADSTQWQPVKLHDTFCPGDVIRVQERSRADIALSNQPMLRLDQNSTMALGGIKNDGGSLVELVKGAAHFFSRLPRNLDVRTAFVNAGVEGTEGVIVVGDDRTEVTIFEGKVVAANEAGTLSITDGQSVVAEKGKAPSYRTVVNPRDAVQWALYYPPVVEVGADAAVNENDARSLAGRAARSLSVGRVDEANADLIKAIKLDPRSADALALQSIIAVVNNSKEHAMALADSAVAANPQSAAARIAKSYAQQAQFDVDGALKSLVDAVKAEPKNGLAWARLAEIRLSLQDFDGGMEAAQHAVELNPNVERAQTVLGFAYLLQVKTKEAQAAFTKAHELDQSAALPQLGLGLAKFREGNVEEGRREMEVAASLDPNNAIIRSYLGKAYFEEKRDNMTEREYKNAKELDPKDPTPFFYDALHKQLTNRPVEALQDMEKAIELNKNRAVYRSQLQMDSDLAARSSALGRVYSDLGFQQVALVEGWNSINTDPTNYAASRFLADSYAALPRHEVARVSELLRSQLLQPLNITPIQPSLAVSNLFLLSSLGPGATSFNEFNTLMVNRDRLTVLGSGLYGDNNNTLAGEGVVGGIYKNFSFSAGYSNFRTDGWRPGANQRDGNVNVFMQYEFSHKTSLQAEYRYRNLQRGDLQQRFYADDFHANLRDNTVTNAYRVGGKHAFTPDSILLANFTYTNTSGVSPENANPAVPPVDLGVPVNIGLIKVDGRTHSLDSYNGELQYVLRSQHFNLVTGGGYTHLNGTPLLSVGFDLTPFGGGAADLLSPPFPFPLQIKGQMRHINGYAYGYFKLMPNLTVTAGGSYDYLDGGGFFVPGRERNSFNPKFGIMYNPFPDTTIRLAAFKTLKRTLLTDQTLEITQVAGFNQFYDDLNGTLSWRYGAAVNQKITKNLFAGVEGSVRTLEAPYITLNDLVVDLGNPATSMTMVGKEYQALGYLLWTPHPWVALRASYSYDQFNNDQVVGEQPLALYQHRIPLGVGFFHPSGLIANVTATYWNQAGTFERLRDLSRQEGRDSFVLVDAGIGYRMPKRYGLLTLGVRNLLNQKFNFYNTDFKNPLIQPDRMVFLKLTFALP